MKDTSGSFDNYLSAVFCGQRDKEASRKFYAGDYGRYLPRDKAAAILDIGCGTGEFIAYLRSAGYVNASGVDACAEMVEFCGRNGIGGVAHVADLKQCLSPRQGRYDLVALNDVIEHIPRGEVAGILKAIKASLKPGGRLLLRTGNVSTPGGAYLRYKDFTHETGYTEDSLKQVLRLAGFEDVAVKGNRYYLSLNPLSLFRAVLLKVWFFVLQGLYMIELGCDRPRIYSKLLVAICTNEKDSRQGPL